VPGITPVAFQAKYADESIRQEVQELEKLKGYSKLPYPQVTLSKEDEQTLQTIQADLSAYAEKAMARFVVGDVPLDDEQWTVFCETAEQKGLSRAVAIWQKYIGGK